MKIQIKCDTCGKIGTPETITENHEHSGSDLCEACAKAFTLASLKQEHTRLKEWLETTHLKTLKELETKIADLEKG